MKYLVPLDNDEYISKIAGSKGLATQNLILPAIQSILELYGYYRINTNNLDQISQACSISKEILDAIKTCYKNPTKMLNELKDKIKDLQKGYTYCPYCGINTNDTFDHYLPSSKFPQFSILSLNLVPCCGQCNRIKGDRYVENPRMIINPYFDSFLRIPFLKAEIIFSNSTSLVPEVTFSIDNSELTQIETHIAASHLKVLNLAERYLEKASGKISEIVVSYRRVASNTAYTTQDLKTLLSSEALSLQQHRGVDNWEAVLCNELTSSDQFWQLCT